MKELRITRGMKEALYNLKIDPEDIMVIKKGYDYMTIKKNGKLFDIRY